MKVAPTNGFKPIIEAEPRQDSILIPAGAIALPYIKAVRCGHARDRHFAQ